MNGIRYAFFWYNDEEIFSFSDINFEKKVEKIAAAGINAVITFSCTHFRWTMRPYWDTINKCLGKIVKACHKYGIKVVEHHSSHLTFDPLNSEDWAYMERVLNKRHSSIDSWKGIRDYIASDPMIDGKLLSSFRQVDGRTGNWARTIYHGYGMCFNNPDYRKAYFSYLEEIYKTGVDGIMTDDVQWFGDGNACTCEHCRKLFRMQTGNELPKSGEEWYKFYGDYDNPVYIAWEKFRRQSTANFHLAVNNHFESLGLKLMRPNYSSHALIHNVTAYALDSVASIWDYIFEENCYSNIIKYSWPSFAMEAVHRYALGERNGVPSMAHFYPDRGDTYYFAWALAQSWGQLFLGTAEGYDMSAHEKKYRDFEKKYSDLLFDNKKQADIVFYFSTKTRDYIKNAASNNMQVLYAWMQSAYVSNISIDMVFECDNTEKLSKYPVIVLPCVSMMSDNEFVSLKGYVENGGTLLILGIPGEKDENGINRTIEFIPERFGVNAVINTLDSEYTEYCTAVINGKEADAGKVNCVYKFENVQNAIAAMKSQNGEVTGICSEFGKGKLLWFINPFGFDKFQHEVRADRWFEQEIRVDSPEYVIDEIKKIPGEIMKNLVEDRLVEIVGKHENIMVSCFIMNNEKDYVVHIVNVDGTLVKETGNIGHSDVIPGFSEEVKYTIPSEYKISLRYNPEEVVKSVKLYTPESDTEYGLDYSVENNRLIINIPQKIFKGYAVVNVTMKMEGQE